MHEHDHGNQSGGTRSRFAWHDRLSAKGNVEGRAAPDRWAAVGSSYSAAKESSKSRSARANRTQLPGAQESSAGNPAPDEIFLGRVNCNRFAVRSVACHPIDFAKVPE